MKPTNPATGRPSTVDRLAEAVPVARLVGREGDDLPDLWTSGRRTPDTWTPDAAAPDVVVLLAGSGDLPEALARIAEASASATAPPIERIWVVAPNPVPTDAVLGLLTGAPVHLDPDLVPNIDATFRRAGWQPVVGSALPPLADPPGVPAPAVRGGMGALLDQLADTSGLGGRESHIVRCYSPLTAAPAGAAEVSRPFLSVLVRTQGTGLRQQTIRDTLVCLAAQSDLDFEVLVLAHRVGADERHALASTVDEFEPLLPGRLRVLEVTEPGRSTPLRVGAKAARGDYVAILDDDDTVLAHWVESFHDLARRAERPAVLRCRSVSQRMEILDRGVAGPGYRAWTEWDAPWSSRFDAMEQLTDNHMPIHSYALPRAPLLGWGLTWDPALPVLEDWDLLMRAVNALGVVDGVEFTSIYRLWPTTVNSQASTDATQWAQVREGLLDRWDRLAWVVPSGTVRHALRAEFALLADRPIADKVRGRIQRLARRSGPALLATPVGRVARQVYRRSGLRPAPPE